MARILGQVPQQAAELATGSDVDFNTNCIGVFVGTGGDIDLEMRGGAACLYKNVPNGTPLYGRFSKYVDADSTVEDVVIWYGTAPGGST